MKSLLFSANNILHNRLMFSGIGKRFFSKERCVYFCPDIHKDAKLILPVSMGRYNISDSKTKEYDDELHILFTHTANLLRLKEISSVDILITTSSQHINNWSVETIQKIDRHFLKTHASVLKEQSNAYPLEVWIDKQGRAVFERNCAIIAEKIKEGTKWHKYIIQGQHAKRNLSLERLLEYHIQEYAAIMLMQNYDYMVYLGSVSKSWANAYQELSECTLPAFVQARIENRQLVTSFASVEDINSEKILSAALENALIRKKIVTGDKETPKPKLEHAAAKNSETILLAAMSDTIVNSNFPAHKKEQLIDKCLGMLFAYDPRNNSKKFNKPKL